MGGFGSGRPSGTEPEAGNGLRQVERAAPRLAPTAEASPLSSAQSPPLPPGTPNAEHSRRRQIATAANALWAVFLKGKDLPVALEGSERISAVFLISCVASAGRPERASASIWSSVARRLLTASKTMHAKLRSAACGT